MRDFKNDIKNYIQVGGGLRRNQLYDAWEIFEEIEKEWDVETNISFAELVDLADDALCNKEMSCQRTSFAEQFEMVAEHYIEDFYNEMESE